MSMDADGWEDDEDEDARDVAMVAVWWVGLVLWRTKVLVVVDADSGVCERREATAAAAAAAAAPSVTALTKLQSVNFFLGGGRFVSMVRCVEGKKTHKHTNTLNDLKPTTI